ncbi:radical SAM family protein [Ezakiella coagulans]|uniref:Radical SAM family protein n=1 Tax=Ezakiella coagulans TaxID=46507 RepID=A0A2U1DML3_9FIRM|nr:radical SAM protein [Ezakiella coagulans]PVY88913.1 radical SAM family protein [Ezakiella coagulans]
MDKFYPKYMYTPMPEMHNEMVPVTAGCSFKKCIYCDLNYKQKFHIFKLDEVENFLNERKTELQKTNRLPKKFTLLEGNPLCVSTDHLISVFKLIHKYFEVEYISMFARATDVLRKSDEELLKLKELGMDRLCLGLESGSDEVLAFHKKGHTAQDSILATRKLDRLGIKYSVYFMLGLGGRNMTMSHRCETAKLLNEIHPFEVVFVTTVIFKRAPLKDYVRNKSFIRMSVKEILEEEIYIIENLNMDTIIKATHKTNPIPLQAKFPEGKEIFLRKLRDYYDSNDEKSLVKNEMKKWKIWDKE